MPLNTPTTPKLTPEQVMQIRDRAKLRDSEIEVIEAVIARNKKLLREVKRAHCNKAIAYDYGVQPTAISRILRGDTWGHVV